jgi:hypothetical protein
MMIFRLEGFLVAQPWLPDKTGLGWWVDYFRNVRSKSAHGKR